MMKHCDICRNLTEHEARELPIPILLNGQWVNKRWVCCNELEGIHAKLNEMSVEKRYRYHNPPPKGWEYACFVDTAGKSATVKLLAQHHRGEWEMRNALITGGDPDYDDNRVWGHCYFDGTTIDTSPGLKLATTNDGNRIEVHDYDLIKLDSVQEMPDG